jgi:hypothetical protein
MRQRGQLVAHRRTAPCGVNHSIVGHFALLWLRAPAEYHGRICHGFHLGHYEVHIDIPLNVKQPSWTAWSTLAKGDDMNITLEKVAHKALTEFCEQHLVDTTNTPIALFPIWD